MSLSLCLIGNSHVAAVKQAWTNRQPTVADGVSLTFFSAALRLLERLHLKGDVLMTRDEETRERLRYTSDGLGQIELSRYDAFIVLGIGFGLDVPRFCDGFDLVTGSRSVPEGKLLSHPAFAAMLDAQFENAYAVTLADTIKTVAEKPVLLCSAPFLSERILTEEDEILSQERYRDRIFLKAVMQMGLQAATDTATRHRCELLWQPECTIGVPGFTKKEYGNSPARFAMNGAAPPAVDRRHGNEEYGYLSLMAMLRKMHEMTGGRVLANASAPVVASAAC